MDEAIVITDTNRLVPLIVYEDPISLHDFITTQLVAFSFNDESIQDHDPELKKLRLAYEALPEIIISPYSLSYCRSPGWIWMIWLKKNAYPICFMGVGVLCLYAVWGLRGNEGD